MDLKKIAAKPDAVLVLRDAHGKELSDENGVVSVTICSPATATWKKAQELYQKEIADGVAETVAQANFCTACTLGSENLQYNGIVGNYAEMYHDDEVAFIRNQVFGGLQRWGNFSPSGKQS
jgi:hypothetical protein